MKNVAGVVRRGSLKVVIQFGRCPVVQNRTSKASCAPTDVPQQLVVGLLALVLCLFRNGKLQRQIVLIGTRSYEFDFNRMVQKNKATKKERAIRSCTGSLCVPLVEHVWRCVAVARLTTSICVVLVQIHITTEDRDSWLKNATVAVFFQDAQSFLHNPLFGRDS